MLRYVERQKNDWSRIQQAEVDVSLVKPEYIIEGKIDLVQGKNGTIEIVDFKSEKKPDMVKDRDKIEHYKQQLNIYAHLIEEKTGQSVSKMQLYYTGEENGKPTIEFSYNKNEVDNTIKIFDDTVKKILNKDFSKCSNSSTVCSNCDFRHYCNS